LTWKNPLAMSDGGVKIMPLFDTFVQELKFKVLSEVAKLAYNDELNSGKVMEIAEKIVPDGEPTTSCCIYKERAIINERIGMAMGGNQENPNVVEVLPIACDECPVDGIHVSEACRGCIAHRCMAACPRDAIQIVNHKATIDKSKCIECGKCAAACPYSAIVKNTRPCVNACKPKAINIDPDTRKAIIDENKCISCGACVYQCPFGAIVDKSFITKAISLINGSNNNEAYHVYAVVAPAMASQYQDITTEQVVAGVKALGFHSVVEAAWGADVVAYLETKELMEKGFLTSSCCPAFVNYIHKNFPKMVEHISHNYSPMAQMSKWLKENDPGCKVICIGPCIAKKSEMLYTKAKEHVDCYITFEEMQALFDARGIDLKSLEGMELDNASYFGRIFARSGGLAVAVEEALKEMGITEEQFKFNPVACNGILECRTALMKAQNGILKENFIEGMACENGCIGGPACLSHSSKNRSQVDDYGKLAMEKTIMDAISVLNVKE
jgi:[FeFe] hydrogenase (group B1/B3)